jgi:hypothetical protein
MRKFLTIITSICILCVACEDLEVDNTNAPDREKLFENTRDFRIFADNIYITYWQSLHSAPYTNAQIATLTAADQFTASWYNFGCYDLSIEPRIAWNNSPNYEYKDITYAFYSNMYTVIYMCNTVIKLLNEGKIISSDINVNKGYYSLCYFLRGAALGNLGLTFDKAQIVSENSDFSKLPFQPYNIVLDSAIAWLQKSIDISDSTSFNLGSNIINGTTITNQVLNRVCHSYIARLMVLGSRTKSENVAVDWHTVLDHAKKGISEDFGPQGDANKWVDEIAHYLSNTDNTQYFFAKVDNRIIHLLDPLYPARYWKSGHPVKVHSDKRAGEASSSDARLASDFEFSSGIRFYPERGTYHFSHYRYKRWESVGFTGIGKMIDISKYENSLYAIEAYAMLNNLDKAIELLNYPFYPRKVRGQLPDIPQSADKKTVLNAIFYEREIELLGQSYLIGFCDMRRRDMLQKGTPLHFPIPGNELQTLKLDYYTFGGTENADGINTSNGGWNE